MSFASEAPVTQITGVRFQLEVDGGDVTFQMGSIELMAVGTGSVSVTDVRETWE